MAAWRQRGLGTWLLSLAAAVAVYAALISWFGGFDLPIGPLRLRSRDATRPAVLSGAAFILFLVIDHRRARLRVASAWPCLEAPAVSRTLLAAALLWTAVAGMVFNTRAAGGSDSYGYVDQVRLFRQGTLVDRVPFDPAFPWRQASRTLVPYGYVPTDAAEVIAPQYPPGLPLLMLPASLLGDTAIYSVVPAFGVLLIVCVWVAGLRLGDRLAAGIAAAVTSMSPTFLFQLVQPMSDVPAAALWLAAILAVGRGRAGDVIAGCLIGMAILVRPNLAPLALVVFLTAWRLSPWTLRRAASFAAPIAAGLALLFYVQFVRYGSPLSSGYGPASHLFAMESVAVNLRQYPAWLQASHGPTIWLAVLAPFVLGQGRTRVFGQGLLAFAAGVWLLYLPYVAFQPHEWHYSRFLLPAIAIMLLLSSVVMLRAIRVLLPEARVAVTATVVLALLIFMGRAAVGRGALRFHEAEQKYPAAAAAVVQQVGPGSWVVAGQHSGSLRFYADSHTLRWDLIDSGDLDRVLEVLEGRGVQPIAVLDPDEVSPFRVRFKDSRALTRMTLLQLAGATRLYRFE